MTARPLETDDVATLARELAQEHGAAVLAAALVVRLRADGRAELAADVARVLAAADGAFIDPNPPDPHRKQGA